MKKSAFYKLSPILIFSAAVFVLPIKAESSKPVALVVKTSGVSTLQRGAKSSPLRVNDLVMSGDRIQTKKNGSVNLQFSTGVIFMIGSNTSDTDVRVTKFEKSSGSQEIGLEMLKGSLAASSEKLAKKDRIQINTPTAIAGVRGTEFIIDCDQDSSEVLVNEGLVAVSDTEAKEEIMVEPGKKVVADTKGFQLEVLDKFEKQRFDIIKAMEESRQKNMEALIEQIERDKKTLEGVKNPFDSME